MDNNLLEENEFYKHKKSKDICIKIVRYTGNDDKGSYYNIEYWNLGCMGKPWRIGKSYGFLIKTKDIENWEKLSDEDFFSERPKSYFYDV